MHADLEVLLELQSDDEQLQTLKQREQELDERARALDAELAAQSAEIQRAEQAVEDEERRRRDLELKVEQHRQLQERNLAALEGVWKAREATAAMSQVDLTRRVLAQEESELHGITGRLVDLRAAVSAQRAELATLESRQSEARGQLEDAHVQLADEMREAQVRRDEKAARVSRGILSRYERIRMRTPNTPAVIPLRSGACGRCNTAIPLQRRKTMSGGRTIESCEGCGVLLYAVE